MAEIFAVETRGIGRTDYSREVAQGQVRPGISLKVNQQLVIYGYTPTDVVPHVPFPYPIPWVLPVLAPGATSVLYDFNTGLPSPAILPVGYGMSLLQIGHTFNQDSEIWLWIDGLLYACLGSVSAGTVVHQTMILSPSTLQGDPFALSPHLVDMRVTNRGGADMRGGIEVVGILEAIGTPPFPSEKRCLCPYCGTLTTAPNGKGIESTRIHCSNPTCTNPNPDKIFYVRDTTGIRQTR